MKRHVFIFLLILALVAVLSGCDKIEPQSPIFSGTTYISTFLPSVTVTTNFPSFTWTAPDSEVVYQVVGVFSQPIVVSDKKISNPQDCVAMWTTGLTGSAGDVSFGYFKVVTGGAMTSSTVNASTLTGGSKYYWAVWGYDKDMTVTHSSGQKSFTY